MRFTNSDLKKMIAPLFAEQLLVLLVGIADTLVISYTGEASVSGVSLVNMVNTIFIYLFTALASGGAVVISQYMGKQEQALAGESASQLLMFSGILSAALMIPVLAFKGPLLRGLFGAVEPGVMDAGLVYLRISAYSYPAIAVYNAGVALYRSLGKTKVTMNISLVSNVINLIGNLIGVFILKAGVAGVAYPSLIARAFSAIAITWLCFRKSNGVYYRKKWIFSWNAGLLSKILRIAVPNGIEKGLFQLVKVAVSSIVALFGTWQIAANGIAQSIWSMAALCGLTMSPVFITVIGQCMGAGDPAEAEYYFKKLTKITITISVLWNGLILAATPVLMRFYALEAETKDLIIQLVLIHNLFNAVAFPFSGAVSSGLRAAGDVKYTTIVSILSTAVGRLILSWLFGMVFNMGVMGIAAAMCCDWTFQAILYILRVRSGKWKYFAVV